MDCNLPGSSVHGIFQARILEWLPFLPLGDFPGPGVKPTSSASPALAGRFFTTVPPGKAHKPYIMAKKTRGKKRCSDPQEDFLILEHQSAVGLGGNAT